jgi:hypothetical protein
MTEAVKDAKLAQPFDDRPQAALRFRREPGVEPLLAERVVRALDRRDRLGVVDLREVWRPFAGRSAALNRRELMSRS